MEEALSFSTSLAPPNDVKLLPVVSWKSSSKANLFSNERSPQATKFLLHHTTSQKNPQLLEPSSCKEEHTEILTERKEGITECNRVLHAEQMGQDSRKVKGYFFPLDGISCTWTHREESAACVCPKDRREAGKPQDGDVTEPSNFSCFS